MKPVDTCSSIGKEGYLIANERVKDQWRLIDILMIKLRSMKFEMQMCILQSMVRTDGERYFNSYIHEKIFKSRSHQTCYYYDKYK